MYMKHCLSVPIQATMHDTGISQIEHLHNLEHCISYKCITDFLSNHRYFKYFLQDKEIHKSVDILQLEIF